MKKLKIWKQENEQKITINLTDPTKGSGLIFNNILGPEDWNKKDYHEVFPLDVNVKQKLDIRIYQANKAKNEDLVTRVMNNNKIRDSIIIEKIVAQKELKKKEILEKTQPSLDSYLRDELEPEVTFIDDDLLENKINDLQ